VEALPIEKIEISPDNVRKTDREKGIEELKNSIEKRGLIHPIIVIPKGDHYEVIVGQRRLIAFRQLGRTSIPALIIDRMDDVGQTVISFGENIHRRKLPYSDTIKVCERLFKQYEGSHAQKIGGVARDLGLSRQTVIRYLAYQLIPKKVRDMVQEDKLSAKKAYDITAAFWPNEGRITEIAETVVLLGLTTAELDRAIDIGRSKPKASIDQILEETKKPPTVITFTITIPTKLMHLVEAEATKRGTDVQDLILTTIQTFLEEGGA